TWSAIGLAVVARRCRKGRGGALLPGPPASPSSPPSRPWRRRSGASCARSIRATPARSSAPSLHSLASRLIAVSGSQVLVHRNLIVACGPTPLAGGLSLPQPRHERRPDLLRLCALRETAGSAAAPAARCRN